MEEDAGSVTPKPEKARKMKFNPKTYKVENGEGYLMGPDGYIPGTDTPEGRAEHGHRAFEFLTREAADAYRKEMFNTGGNVFESAPKTVGGWIKERELTPDGYDPINDDHPIEAVYRTKAGSEMIVFAYGEAWIIDPHNASSGFHTGDIRDFLALPNNQDWIKQEA